MLLLVFVFLQIEKGKLHGSIDVALSVMAIKKKSKRIDLDAEDNIYHLKVKDKSNRNAMSVDRESPFENRLIRLAAGC